MENMKEIGFALYIFISLVYGLPIGTHVTVRAKKNPSVDRIIVNVRKRRSKYWDFWEVNNSKSCIYTMYISIIACLLSYACVVLIKYVHS